MNIRYKNYLITSDQYNITLHKVMIAGKDAKNPGEEYTTPYRYYPSVESLLRQLLDIEVFEGEVTTFQEMLDQIKKLREELLAVRKEGE